MAGNITISGGSITLKQGTTASWAYVIKNGVNVVDITGWTAAAQVRATMDSTTALLTFTPGHGLDIDGPNGAVTITVTPDLTTALRFRGDSLEGVYDVEVTNTLGEVTRIAEGSFTITREVTRL